MCCLSGWKRVREGVFVCFRSKVFSWGFWNYYGWFDGLLVPSSSPWFCVTTDVLSSLSFLLLGTGLLRIKNVSTARTEDTVDRNVRIEKRRTADRIGSTKFWYPVIEGWLTRLLSYTPYQKKRRGCFYPPLFWGWLILVFFFAVFFFTLWRRIVMQDPTIAFLIYVVIDWWGSHFIEMRRYSNLIISASLFSIWIRYFPILIFWNTK